MVLMIFMGFEWIRNSLKLDQIEGDLTGLELSPKFLIPPAQNGVI